MKVCVIGLGKVGLPLAAHLAQTYEVIGVDCNPDVTAAVNNGNPLISEPGLLERLWRGNLAATTDIAGAIRQSQVVVVVVPLLLDSANKPDFANIDAVTKVIADNLDGQLVIYETTLPVGTTRNRFGKVLAATGKEFALAFSPERISSGQVFDDFNTYPKVVGGDREISLLRVVDFYERCFPAVLPASSLEAAEFSKLAECVYRDVNIGLANEFAVLADGWGVPVTEVIALANSQPFSYVHQPGIGVGGHCIPVYPHFLPDWVEIPMAARQFNEAMPGYVLEKLRRELGGLSGKSILIAGLSYRAGVRETYKSVALDLIDLLISHGAIVYANDPLFSEDEIGQFAYFAELEAPMDAVILQAYHEEYKPFPLDKLHCRALVDGRNWLNRVEVEHMGMTYIGVGQ